MYRANADYDDIDPEVEELRAEDAARRRRHAAWMHAPDPRDPAHPDEESRCTAKKCGEFNTLRCAYGTDHTGDHCYVPDEDDEE